MEKVGLIGSGVMGLTVAPRLVDAGHELYACDVSAEARQRLTELGANVVATPREVAQRADIVLMLLPGPKQVEECVTGTEGLLAGARAGVVLVDMSTIDPGTTRRMAGLARVRSVGYLDALVLGRPASVGQWALPVGGRRADLDRCVRVFDRFAAKVFHVGESGAGHKIKLLNQLMFSAINAMTAEMMAVAEKAGVSPGLLFETITASQAGTVSNLFKELGRRIAEDDYGAPTFNIDLLCKDLRLAIEMAQEAQAPPLLARTIQFLNEAAQAQGYGSSDTAVMWKALLKMWEKPV
jgi:3-hydroxyisobutyrate dehydrogenase-like beta-hydroxyacid dehydrogenase